MDIYSKEKRSEVMSNIRSSRTKPELLLRKELKGLRLRYQPKMPFNPDFVSKKSKVAIFVDGDFWHGYNWKKKGKIPPKGFWQLKIKRNMARDKLYTKCLKREGWMVLRFWEHDILSNIKKCVFLTKRALTLKSFKKKTCQ
jgi:DNA mismatch endonuclease, patch repair protein